MQLENILSELSRSIQVSFDKFETQCENVIEKAVEFDKKLVEIKMEYRVIMKYQVYKKKVGDIFGSFRLKKTHKKLLFCTEQKPR